MTAGAARIDGQWIGGRWTGGMPDMVTTNPAHPRREVTRFASADDQAVDEAVATAAGAAARWRTIPAQERAGLLRGLAGRIGECGDHLARLITLESGKVLSESSGEVARAIDTLHYNAARALAPGGEVFDSPAAGEQIRTLRFPVGTVALITPWNFPLAIPIWKIAPALAHGNTVVWKPSELTPAVAAALAGCIADAGLPIGVVNIVFGAGGTGARLVDDARVDAISFTGSVATGERILRSAGVRGVRVQLELGGHNPALVFDDADLGRAADHVCAGAMLAAGQKCTATRRVLVQQPVYLPFVERLLERVAALRVGDGFDEHTDLGPLVSADARERVEAAVAQAVTDGADLLAGGAALDDPALDGGHYLAPTVLAVRDQRPLTCREEVFGPVTSVLAFGDDDQAFALANDTAYGLSAAAHTASQTRAERALVELEAGQVSINGTTTGAELHVPFGGVKASSGPGGREQGEAAREFFTQTRTCYVHPAGW